MKVITVGALKGGVGKSTTAAAIAQAAAAEGKKVLAVDMDPAANLSFFLGESEEERAGSFEAVTEEAPAKECIQSTAQGLDLMAGSVDLSALKSSHGSAKKLRAALRSVADDYDLVIVDTPATVGELYYNALTASEGLLIPVQADVNALQGMLQVIAVAAEVRARVNSSLEYLAAIVTNYDSRPKINRHIRERIQEEAEAAGAEYLGEIRPGIAIKEAQGFQESLYQYAPKSKPALDYLAVYHKLIKGE